MRAAEISPCVAGPDDEPDLRRLLRDNPMQGHISLALHREPNFFLGAAVEGDLHQTLACRDTETGALISMGSRSTRDCWVNGQPMRLGYLGQLRVDRRYQGFDGGLALLRTFRHLRQLDRRDGPPFYIAAVSQDNLPAHQLLRREQRGKPTFRPLGGMCNLALPLWRRRRPVRLPGVELRQAGPEHLDDIAACLRRNLSRYQLAPVWKAGDLTHPRRTRDLKPTDFRIALKGGRICGCLAAWDQQGFKQTVVHGYPGGAWRLRHLANLAAPLTRWPRLPEVGEPLRHIFLSHMAMDEDDPALLAALITSTHNRLMGRGYAYLAIGFSHGSPLLAAVKRRFLHLEYRTVLYLAHWRSGACQVDALDSRPVHLELAVL